MQPHPEFVADYSACLQGTRRVAIGEYRYAAGLAEGHAGLDVARLMQAFVERRARPAA